MVYSSKYENVFLLPHLIANDDIACTLFEKRYLLTRYLI